MAVDSATLRTIRERVKWSMTPILNETDGGARNRHSRCLTRCADKRKLP
jgi:hypothetical protein